MPWLSKEEFERLYGLPKTNKEIDRMATAMAREIKKEIKKEIAKQKQIQDEILKIIDDHSGGMKFLELLTELISRAAHKDPEGILRLCKKHPKLKVLEYSMILGPKMVRVKYFVYRPLKQRASKN